MLLKREISFQTPGGMWRKEAVSEQEGDFPEAATIPEPNRTLYKLCLMDDRLMLVRFFAGNLTAEQYAEAHQHLGTLAARYAGVTAEAAPDGS